MADTYIGRVSNVVVVLEGAIALPEGTRRMLLAWGRRAEAVAPPRPDDLAAEHDHYAHGKPRA
jgi:hypothetical protein